MAKRDIFPFVLNILNLFPSHIHYSGIYCCIPYYPPNWSGLKQELSHISQFRRNRNLCIAQLDTPGSMFPMRIQSSCQAGLCSHLKTLLWWNICSQVHTCGGWKSSDLTMWTSLLGCSQHGSLLSPKQIIQVREHKKRPPRWKP